MRNYGLSFISNRNLFDHTLATVKQFRTGMSLKDFQKNIVDPIKLTFDVHVYQRSIEDVITSEIIRQLEKTNENLIGYFHQNIFKYVGNGWNVPQDGFDVENHGRRIYAEIKNKHNTMNSSAAKAVHAHMRGLVEGDSKACCYLVEIVAKKSQNIPWCLQSAPLRPDRQERLRRISIDRFYEIVTSEKFAFRDLCQTISHVIDDILRDDPHSIQENTVLKELKQQDGDILKQLFLRSFGTYRGFDDFQISK